MAEQMQSIKRRIKSINSTERITNAMKLVSASKLRKTKAAFESSRIYLGSVLEAMHKTFYQADEVPAEFLAGDRELKTVCLVIFTSSNGLCGSFNSNVIREAEARVRGYREQGIDVKIISIGSKGGEYFQRRNIQIIGEHNAATETFSFEESCQFSTKLIELFHSHGIDKVELIYTSYVNTLKQSVISSVMLPVEISEENKSKYDAEGKHLEIEYEPSPEEVFKYLILKYIELSMFGAAIESATCEYAARRTAMENANDNAGELLASLRMEYNRARQAEITDEIIEIVAGSQAQN